MVLACLPLACGGETKPAEETAPPAPVKWMEAREMFIEEWTEVVGTTQPLPDRSARVTAAIEGRVVSVLQGADGKAIAEGQRVQKGDVLVRLDDHIAQANYEKAIADQRSLKQQIDQADLAIRVADVDLRARQDLIKQSAGGPITLVPQIDLEKAEVALADAKSKRVGVELQYKAGEKALKALEEQLRLFTLTAPIGGRLSRPYVVLGQTLSVGTTVAEILDIEKEIDLLCFVPPHIMKKLKLGQTIRLGAPGEQQAAIQAAKTESADSSSAPKPKQPPAAEGKIVYISDQSEVDTGNFAVKARFPNTRLKLASNVTFRARVLTTPGKACLTLPELALMEDQDPPMVVVVEDYKQEKNKEGKEEEVGKARRLRVRVGIRDKVLHLVEVLGLEDPEKKWQGSLETAKFVTERGQGLRNGDAIRLEAEDEDEAPAEEKKEG
jgi:RND family efflux transporter MFP subunit